jgi:dTDP-3-amino-3,4,6-trideoxy-alpha-D-glucose transaminase
LLLIEDAAQAQGARWNGSRCGSLGDVAAFSFYPGKNLGSCGEGGAVTTSDDAIARKVRILREHGQSQKYFHEIEGYNARLHAIQARFLEIKLRRLDAWNAARRANAEKYLTKLQGIPDLRLPVVRPEAEPIWHLYVVETAGRNELQKYLTENGVACGLHYPFPLHLLPAYAHLGYQEGDFPNAERSCNGLLSLPMFPEMSDAQINRVAECVRTWAERALETTGPRTSQPQPLAPSAVPGSMHARSTDA